MRFSTYCWLAVENSPDYDRTPRIREWLWARDVNTAEENYANNIQLARMSPHKWIRLVAEAVTCVEEYSFFRPRLEAKAFEALQQAVYGLEEWGDLPDISAYKHAGTYWEVSLPDYIERRTFYGRTMHEIHSCTLAVVYKDGDRIRIVDPRDFQTLLDLRERQTYVFEEIDESPGTLRDALDLLMARLMDSMVVPAEMYKQSLKVDYAAIETRIAATLHEENKP